jgi:hypothetical protein
MLRWWHRPQWVYILERSACIPYYRMNALASVVSLTANFSRSALWCSNFSRHRRLAQPPPVVGNNGGKTAVATYTHTIIHPSTSNQPLRQIMSTRIQEDMRRRQIYKQHKALLNQNGFLIANRPEVAISEADDVIVSFFFSFLGDLPALSFENCSAVHPSVWHDAAANRPSQNSSIGTCPWVQRTIQLITRLLHAHRGTVDRGWWPELKKFSTERKIQEVYHKACTSNLHLPPIR